MIASAVICPARCSSSRRSVAASAVNRTTGLDARILLSKHLEEDFGPVDTEHPPKYELTLFARLAFEDLQPLICGSLAR